jgi:CBS domain-containing protein
MAATKTVGELMTVRVSTLGIGDTMDIADGIMCMGRIRHLPVVDEARKVVGVVSQRDLLRRALGAALAFGTREPQKLMRSLEVRDVMSEPAVIIDPAAAVQDAARTMFEKKIGCLPVVEQGKLVGILTETDVLRYAMAR